MQITLNQSEVSEVVLGHIQDKLGLDDSNNFHVDVNEDGSITVLVNEETNDQSDREQTPTGSTGSRQKKPRRTKAQIEADNLAEEAAKQAAKGNDSKTPDNPSTAEDFTKRMSQGNGQESTQTTSVEGVKPTEPAPAEDAGDTNQNQEAPVGEVIPDPSEFAESTVVVEGQGTEHPAAEEVVETTTAEPDVVDGAAVKPAGVSLFANLRRPNNG